MNIQTCPSCKEQLPDDACFCGRCGYDLTATIVVKPMPEEMFQKALAAAARAQSAARSSKELQADGDEQPEKVSPAGDAASSRVGPPLAGSLGDGTHGPGNGAHNLKNGTHGPGAVTRARQSTVGAINRLAKVGKSAVGAINRLLEVDISTLDTINQMAEADKSAVGAINRPLEMGWLPLLAFIDALGVFVVAFAYNAARNQTSGADLLFIAGLLVIFLPVLIRLFFPQVSRFERISLLCVVGIAFYLVNVTYSPLYFTGYDEFLHWITATDIASSGHLFGTNSLLPVSPYYPGLEIVTNLLSRLSGLSIFGAGLIVVGAARLVMVLSLFLLAEQVTKSARIAGLATILYMVNPHFLFFDAQFAYESLALPLAVFVLFAVTRHETMAEERRSMLVVACLALAAVIVTHHATGFILVGMLLLWALVYAWRHSSALLQSGVAQTALVGVVLTGISIVLIGKPLQVYFLSFAGDLLHQIQQLAQSGSGHQLFASEGGQPVPPWQRIISLASVGLITLSLPFAFVVVWKRYRSGALLSLFALISLAYPFTQLLRLTTTGAEISSRISAYLFVPLAIILAILITQFSLPRLDWRRLSLISGVIAVALVGGVILSNGAISAFLPGPYLVVADTRSIDPEGIQAALWARTHLGPGNRITSDRINSVLMATYGEQRLVTPAEDHIDLAEVFFSTTFSPYESSLLQRGQTRYLVVDLRLSSGLPVVGFYFEPEEANPWPPDHPLPQKVLTKFDAVPQLDRVFDSGDIVIYGTGGLFHAP